MSQFRKFLSILFLSILYIGLSGCASMSGTPEGTDTNSAMQQKFGIEVINIRLTAANYMLNFKYKVLDPEKAAPLHNRKLKPTLIHESTGSKFAVPVTGKLGAIRSSPKFAKAGKNYFMFFGNPGGYIKAGDLVTIIIGDFKVEHIKVM